MKLNKLRLNNRKYKILNNKISVDEILFITISCALLVLLMLLM